MSKDWRYGVGMVTIAGVLGLTAYSIYLWRKEQKEEEGEITLEEAQEIVNSEKSPDEILEEATETFENTYGHNPEAIEDTPKQFVERVAKIRAIEEADEEDDIPIARPLEEVEEEQRLEDEQQVEEELKAEQEKYEVEPEPILLEDEGEGKLRYDPNSDEALEQFIRMELAEWHPSHSVYKTMERLFSIEFTPNNDGDHHLWSNLSDHRAEFFGPASRWTQRVTFADLVLHYARRADYNIGGSAKYWAQELIEANDMDRMLNIESLEEVIKMMNDHVYIYHQNRTYGFFSLSEDSWFEVRQNAKSTIDGAVTYEMEFNEFLKNFN